MGIMINLDKELPNVVNPKQASFLLSTASPGIRVGLALAQPSMKPQAPTEQFWIIFLANVSVEQLN
jgi:hypothetical protein